MKSIELLDCTLRDGSYIVDGKFGDDVIRGIVKKLDAARIDIVECGWLKDASHVPGSAYFHVPEDARPYLPSNRSRKTVYTVMIDWDRYDLDALPPRTAGSIDAIRLVFPHGRHREALSLASKITSKGYLLYLQAANTLAYTDVELRTLAEDVNRSGAVSLSIVDTFGAMYPDDLDRIYGVLDACLKTEVKLGFHSHNNQQLSFALCMDFLRLGANSARSLVVDSSLCGMGRGAGNATTELVASFLNRSYAGNYDLNEILDAIDLYLIQLKAGHEWGYSIPYFIAGIYCTHVNNIAYLRTHHKTLAKDMRIIIESIDPETRKKYDYANLERIYTEYQSRIVDDERVLLDFSRKWAGRSVLLLAPGLTLRTESERIHAYIDRVHPVVMGVNHVPAGYACDVFFFVNALRYQYACDTASPTMNGRCVVVTSNIRNPASGAFVVNFNLLAKQGWRFFDNGTIMALRFLSKIGIGDVAFAGFDGFPTDDSRPYYANRVLQAELPTELKAAINADVVSMLRDFEAAEKGMMKLKFITTSQYGVESR